MPFPPADRVIYKKNPLHQVICQIRFPTILRIDAELPAEFQEKIRSEYPVFRERIDSPIQIPPEMMQLMPQGMGGALLGATKKVYDFVSEDEELVLSLHSEFIALTTNDYTKWEIFRKHLEKSFEALVDVYNPSFVSRIGLRYINVIRRSILGLEDVRWIELLQPEIAGVLRTEQIEDSIEENASIILIRLLNDLGHVRIRHGFTQFEKDNKTELSYLIDSDFFIEGKTEKPDVFELLDQFNKRSGRLFHWSITQRLHDAMEPEGIQRH